MSRKIRRPPEVSNRDGLLTFEFQLFRKSSENKVGAHWLQESRKKKHLVTWTLWAPYSLNLLIFFLKIMKIQFYIKNFWGQKWLKIKFYIEYQWYYPIWFGWVWFGRVWLGNLKKETLNQKTFEGKSGSKLNLIMTIRDATLFGLVLVWFGLVW